MLSKKGTKRFISRITTQFARENLSEIYSGKSERGFIIKSLKNYLRKSKSKYNTKYIRSKIYDSIETLSYEMETGTTKGGNKRRENNAIEYVNKDLKESYFDSPISEAGIRKGKRADFISGKFTSAYWEYIDELDGGGLESYFHSYGLEKVIVNINGRQFVYGNIDEAKLRYATQIRNLFDEFDSGTYVEYIIDIGLNALVINFYQ